MFGCYSNCVGLKNSSTYRQLTGLNQTMATSQGAGTLALNGYAIQSLTMMTVEYCQDFCYTFGFAYAGLDTGQVAFKKIIFKKTVFKFLNS